MPCTRCMEIQKGYRDFHVARATVPTVAECCVSAVATLSWFYINKSYVKNFKRGRRDDRWTVSYTYMHRSHQIITKLEPGDFSVCGSCCMSSCVFRTYVCSYVLYLHDKRARYILCSEVTLAMCTFCKYIIFLHSFNHTIT